MSAVFSIDKNQVRNSFVSAAKRYDGLATLQRKVGLDLINQFDLCNNTQGIVVDMGCGTGFLTEELIKRATVKQMVAVDIAYSMLQVSRKKLQQWQVLDCICADAEKLPFQAQSVDTLVSNLALQWCQHLAEVFTGFNQCLKPNGPLFFSTFAPATLQELKQSWATVDNYAHVNQFYSADELLVFLQQAGFKHIQIETQRYQENYLSVMELMQELKGIGAHNVLSGRNRKTTRKVHMQRMIEAYEKYRFKGLIPATYDIIFVAAKT